MPNIQQLNVKLFGAKKFLDKQKKKAKKKQEIKSKKKNKQEKKRVLVNKVQEMSKMLLRHLWKGKI